MLGWCAFGLVRKLHSCDASLLVTVTTVDFTSVQPGQLKKKEKEVYTDVWIVNT